MNGVFVALIHADVGLADDGHRAVGFGEDMDNDRVSGAKAAARGGDDIGAREGE